MYFYPILHVTKSETNGIQILREGFICRNIDVYFPANILYLHRLCKATKYLFYTT